jgi:hypothetical protein
MCEEKKLLLAYEQLELALSKLLTTLKQKAGTLSKPDYYAMRQIVDLARLETERARITFDAHVLEHGC